MSLQHTRLEDGAMSANVAKVVNGPMKLMAARGMAPIPDPGDLITALYQLALDAEAPIREAAAKSAAELPDNILSGGLAAPVDPRVLDFFAGRVRKREAMIQVIVLNGATADETIADLAGRIGQQLADLIAQNEQRLLRHPAIIGALYTNPRARMSTVDRAVELAVRNQIKVPGIPAWDEVTKAVLGQLDKGEKTTAEQDELFADVAGGEIQEVDETAKPDAELKDIPISEMTIPMKIRLATLGNKTARSQLIRDPLKLVASAAIKAPGVTDMEAAKYASNHSLCDDVIHYIASRRDWTKLYGIKVSLVQNPKTPIPAAIRFMQHLREKDLRQVARSKGVPSAINAQAKKLLMARQRIGGKR
jgi:hypothetical protein